MKNKNIYKPRYKIPFQAKNKNFIYKNCRMRRFFNIRGRKLQRRGIFKRKVLVLNNVKWAVARRNIKPYTKNRRSVRNTYRKIFYKKQQIRHFYGKGREMSFQNFLRNFLVSVKWRNNSFFAALERRLDMVVYRMKILPTIFACNQLIHHYGIRVNRKIEKTPHSLIRVGDMITLAKSHWNPVFIYINKLILFRTYGDFIGKRRNYKNIKKKLWWLKKKWKFRRNTFSLIRKKFKLFYLIKILKPNIKFYQHLMWKGWPQFSIENNQSNEVLSSFKMIRNKSFLAKITNMDKILNIKQDKITDYQNAERVKNISKFLNKTVVYSRRKLRKVWLKNKRKKILFFKWRWRKNYSSFLKTLSFNYDFIQTYNYLWMLLRLEEIRQLRYLLKSIYLKKIKQNLETRFINEIEDIQNYQKLNMLLWNFEKFIIKKYKYLYSNILSSYKYVLKKKLKRKKKKNTGLKRMISFYIKHTYKKQRKLWILRFKNCHWYLPKYLEFNLKTMSGMLISIPKSNDIYFPFRCSLKQIYSFYRSRGY